MVRLRDGERERAGWTNEKANVVFLYCFALVSEIVFVARQYLQLKWTLIHLTTIRSCHVYT